MKLAWGWGWAGGINAVVWPTNHFSVHVSSCRQKTGRCSGKPASWGWRESGPSPCRGSLPSRGSLLPRNATTCPVKVSARASLSLFTFLICNMGHDLQRKKIIVLQIRTVKCGPTLPSSVEPWPGCGLSPGRRGGMQLPAETGRALLLQLILYRT